MKSFHGLFVFFFFGVVVLTIVVLVRANNELASMSQSEQYTSAQSQVAQQTTIESLPPTYAVEGQQFMYRVVTNDTQGATTVVPVNKPDWLIWNQSKQLLQGLVPAQVTSFSVILGVQSGMEIITKQEFTVSVQAATTVVGSRMGPDADPFHPRMTTTPQVYTDAQTTGVNKNAVLGAKTSWQDVGTMALFLGIPVLLLVFCGLLIYRIVKPVKRVMLQTSSGATIQTTRS